MGTVKLLSSRQQNARCRRQPRSCRPGDISHLSPGGECLITGGMKRGGDGCVIEFVACQTPPVAPFRYFTDDNLTVPFSAMAARYSPGIPDTYRTASGLNSDFQGSNPRRRANPTDLPTKAYFRNIAQRVSRPCKRANPRSLVAVIRVCPLLCRASCRWQSMPPRCPRWRNRACSVALRRNR